MCVWAFKIRDIQCLMTLQTSPFRIVIHIDIQQDTPLFTRKKITGEAQWTIIGLPFIHLLNHSRIWRIVQNGSTCSADLALIGCHKAFLSAQRWLETTMNCRKETWKPYQLQAFRSLLTANSYGIETLQCAGILPKTFIWTSKVPLTRR